MNIDELWDVFSPPVALWARKHLRLEFSTNMLFPTAGTVLTPTGYRIMIHPDFAVGGRHTRLVLLHELSHIFRGDCINQERMKDPLLYNYAEDAIINQHLPKGVVKEIDQLQYFSLAKEIDLPTNYIVSTQMLYERLKSLQKKGSCSCGGHSTKGNKGKCEEAHVRTILSARGEVQKELEAETGAGFSRFTRAAGDTASRGAQVEAPAPLPIALPNQILRNLKRFFGTRKRVRSWCRPGRVPLLRGSIFEPKYHLLVAIDVSGSCVSSWPQLGGAAAYLAKRHNVDVSVFDTKAIKTKSLTNLPIFGGGTLIQPVFDLFRQGKYDALIVLTDGQLYDWPTDLQIIPKEPIVWIVINGELGSIQLRDVDTMIALEISK